MSETSNEIDTSEEAQVLEPFREDDLSDLLAQYNKPMDESPAENELQEPGPSNTTPNVDTQDTTLGGQAGDWRGNPLYYQTGKKIGQLRPVSKLRAQSNPVPDTEVNGGDVLDGEMLVMLIDTVIPMVIAMGNNAFSPYKIDPDKMELTNKQTKTLERLCEKAAAKLVVKGDPLIVLVVLVICIYGMQFYTLRQEAKLDYENARRKEAEKTNT